MERKDFEIVKNGHGKYDWFYKNTLVMINSTNDEAALNKAIKIEEAGKDMDHYCVDCAIYRDENGKINIEFEPEEEITIPDPDGREPGEVISKNVRIYATLYAEEIGDVEMTAEELFNKVSDVIEDKRIEAEEEWAEIECDAIAERETERSLMNWGRI